MKNNWRIDSYINVSCVENGLMRDLYAHKLNPLLSIVVSMQVGIVLDRGLGGIVNHLDLTQKRKITI